MAASKAERNKAARIRKKARKTAADRQWLANYEAKRDSGARRMPDTTQTLNDASPAFSSPAPTLPSADPLPGFATLDFVSPEPAVPEPPRPVDAAPPAADAFSGPHAGAGACAIPNCYRCKSVRGSQICGTTGERVWPQITEFEAESMAGMVLFLIGLGVSYKRPDRRLIPPTDKERADMAAAIRESSYRRAPWVGAVSDLFALFGAVTQYTNRAIDEPLLPTTAPGPTTPTSRPMPVTRPVVDETPIDASV